MPVKVVLLLMLVLVSKVEGAQEKTGQEQEMTREQVVLLHGLFRTGYSMRPIERYLVSEGYEVFNIGYDSRKKTVQELVDGFLVAELEQKVDFNRPVHFVTHSMGGILVRYYLQDRRLPQGSRVVMLAPPNKGSEVVDFLGGNILFRMVNGPAGTQLGTSGLPVDLAPVDAEVGVIAGDLNLSWWYSWMINGANDGKVSVESTRLAEMKDFLVVRENHTFMMGRGRVHEAIDAFIQTGSFSRTPGELSGQKQGD